MSLLNLKSQIKTRLGSLQWRLVFIFISMALVLVIPVSLYLKMQVESVYYNSFKRDIERGNEVWHVSENAHIQDLWNDLKSDPAGKKYAVFLFNITTENKTYTLVDTERIGDIYSASAENGDDVILSTDPYFLQKNTRNKFIDDLLRSDNFISAVAGQSGGKKTLMSSFEKTFFDYALRKGRFVIYFRYYSEDWLPTIETLNNSILYSVFIAVLVSLVLGYVLSKTITSPIVSIMHKAQEIARGNFDQTVEVRSDDEIGKLTSAFNYMARELKDTLEEISSEKNKIETILNYMTDGVVAFNLRGELIHANPASKRILGTDETWNSFDEFSSKLGLGLSLKEIGAAGGLSWKESILGIGEKYVRVYFAPDIAKTGSIIAVLHDVTEQQKLENLRREFVANVSHELKTPLTSIRTYTETLLDGAVGEEETKARFLGVILSETDRMNRLVRDLLQLSSLDNKQVKWNKKPVFICDLVKNAVEKVRLEAKAKGHHLECVIEGDIPRITVDYDRIEQVVLNILSNAIKYTPPEGTIKAYVGKMPGRVYIKVADNGIGIPKEDLPRIFERFYRVDKARSRELGGTGLGLSIAQEIVEAHGGNISAESEPGKGTEITVTLPIDAAQPEAEDRFQAVNLS